MAISIKTTEEIEKMRIVGRLAAEVLQMIEPHVQAGITTDELNEICHNYITDEQKTIPAPLNYRGFPKSICTSVNHVVCHGIPGNKKLKDGDILNIDITVIKDEYHGDTSKMFLIGTPSKRAQRLVQTTYDCMHIGIDLVKPGIQLGDIGHAIQHYAESTRFLFDRSVKFVDLHEILYQYHVHNTHVQPNNYVILHNVELHSLYRPVVCRV